MDSRERARGERAVFVVGDEFDQQRARFLVDRVRGRPDRRVERAIGILGQFEGRLHAVLHRSRVGFRHGNIDPHLMNVGDREQAAPSFESALTSDPTSTLRAVTTPSNGATILANAFCAFSRSTFDWAASTSAALRARVAVLFVDGLLRHGAGGAQRIPPRRRHLRQCEVRLGLREFALRDSDALVEFGRVHDRQHLALMNLGADVLAPFLDVAAHLAMNGGGIKGFDIAGQNEFAGFASLLRARPARPLGSPARRSIERAALRHAAVRQIPVAAMATAATLEQHDRTPRLHRAAIVRIGA